MTPSFPIAQPYAPAGPQEQINPLQRLACTVWLIELAIFYSRFFDEIGSRMHIPAFFLILLVFTSLMSGKILRGFSNTAGKFMAAFVVWVTIAVIFSIWKTGSIPSYQALLFSLLYLSVIAGVLPTFREVRQTMYVLAGSLFVAALMSFVFGSYRQERLVMEVGTYGDPNQYAMCLLMGIPLWWFIASTSQNGLTKVVCYCCTIPMFWAFFRTGSRGGLLGLMTILVLLFFRSSAAKKIALVGVTVLSGLLFSALLPNYLQERYKATFEDSPSNNGMSFDAGSDEAAQYLKTDSASAEGRKLLLLKSIDITLHHPILGVGPGNFPAAVFADAQKSGEKYAWFVTHNAYTQISSETGIPGLILFVGIFVCSFKNLARVLRLTGSRSANPRPDLWKAAMYLTLVLSGICVCMFFLSVGFTAEAYVLAGLTIALERVERLEPGSVSLPAPDVMAGFRSRGNLKVYREPRWAKPSITS